MTDHLLISTALDGQIRAYVTRTTGLVEKAARLHGLYPTSADALGRVLTAAALMGATLKDGEESVTLRVLGDGPLGAIVAVGQPTGAVRGYVENPHVFMPRDQFGKFAFANAVGMGNLFITRALGLREPYTGSVPLTSGEIAADISEYYMSSEQIPSACGLGVRIDRDGRVAGSGGFILQLLPGADSSAAGCLEENIQQMDTLSRLFSRQKTPEEILELLFAGFPFRIHQQREVAFSCTCSREKYRAIMGALDPAELRSMIEEDHGAEAVCRFCATRYWFDEEELWKMLEERKESPSGDVHHHDRPGKPDR